MHAIQDQRPAAPGVPLSGIGVSATLAEAVKLCRWRDEGRHAAWEKLDYIQIGLYSRERAPEALPAALRDSRLGAVVHLLELNLMHPLDLRTESFRRLASEIETIEPVCVEEDLGLWRWGSTELEQHMLPPIFDAATAATIANNASKIQEALGVPFLVENPPVHFALGDLDLLAFMQRVAEEACCGVVLDIGHLIGYCVATDRDPEDYLEAWDGIEHVRELHIAGYDLVPDRDGPPMWYDNHANAVSAYALELAALASRRARRILPVTLEQEGATYGRIAAHIERVHGRFSS